MIHDLCYMYIRMGYPVDSTDRYGLWLRFFRAAADHLSVGSGRELDGLLK